MRFKLTGVLLMALFLAIAPTAVASTTWYVDGVNGSDSNNCMSSQTACKTIGHAISLASSGDSIMVAAATYTENLIISVNLNIVGSGAKTTIVDGGGVGTVVAIPNSSSNVTLAKLTIQHGSLLGNGGGIYNNGTLTINKSTIKKNSVGSFRSSSGGGIYNGGTLTINNSTLSGNRAGGIFGGSGGGIYNGGTLTVNNSILSRNTASSGYKGGGLGGGIYNGGTVTINNSTLSGNVDYGSAGGGILNYGGTLTINKSTLSGNVADAYSSGGGGIYNYGGTLTIINSTVSGNSALGPYGSWGGGIYNDGGTLTIINNGTLNGNVAGAGGGIYNHSGSTVALQNSIVANSPSGGNCSGTMTSNGYNLSSDNTCNFSGPGDRNNTDPLLGQLGNYGGPTQTIPLLSGSSAIDAGNPSGCTDGQGHLLKIDQRGKPRQDKEDNGGCDMGAYERQKD